MHYRVRLHPHDGDKRHHVAKFESWDGTVIAATPALEWAIGLQVERLLRWVNAGAMTWRVYESSRT